MWLDSLTTIAAIKQFKQKGISVYLITKRAVIDSTVKQICLYKNTSFLFCLKV